MRLNLLIVFLGLAALLSGCSLIKDFKGPYYDLIGQWDLYDRSIGGHRLTFNRDKTFELDYDGDGVKDIWGEYYVFGDRVTFKDDREGCETECAHNGYYYFKRKGNNFTFIVFADQCVPRRGLLKYLWRKVEK